MVSFTSRAKNSAWRCAGSVRAVSDFTIPKLSSVIYSALFTYALVLGGVNVASNARAATLEQQLIVCHATNSCSPCTCAAATSGPSATSPDSICHQVTRWDQPLPWEQADYAAKQAQAQQRALLTLLGGMTQVVARTVSKGKAMAGELAAAGAVSAAQLQQFVAEASDMGAAAASLMAKAVASFAPAPQYAGPQPEQLYLQHQQPQQREPAMHPLAFHKLALAATHPQLWSQMSVEVPLHQAAHQAQQQMQQGLDAVAFLSGVTPAAAAVITPKVYSTVADMASSLTASLSLHQRTEKSPRESSNAVAATPAANTTCSYDETPYVPVPAPAPVPEQCPLPTLQVLVSCADATAAAPAAAANSISCPMCSTCSECSTQESLWVSATADELLGLDAFGVAPAADAFIHTVSAVSGKTLMAVDAVFSPTISWTKRMAQPVASHPQVQLVVLKLHEWSSGLRFTAASIALQLSTATRVSSNV